MAIIDHYSWKRHVERLLSFLRDGRVLEAFAREFTASPHDGKAQICANITADSTGVSRSTEDAATTEVAKFVHFEARHTKAWYEEVESHLYDKVAPWLPKLFAFEQYSGKKILQIDAGIGTDLAQFAMHGALVTDLDHSAENLEFARENFRLRGLEGTFLRDTGANWPFQNASFDLIYCDMSLNTIQVFDTFLSRAREALRTDGLLISTFLADRSLNFWRDTVLNHGIRHNMMRDFSLDEIMLRKSDAARSSGNVQARVFTRAELRRAFRGFKDVRIQQRQLLWEDLPRRLKWFPLGLAERLVGSRLIVTARGMLKS